MHLSVDQNISYLGIGLASWTCMYVCILRQIQEVLAIISLNNLSAPFLIL